jgi:hypothetical protein
VRDAQRRQKHSARADLALSGSCGGGGGKQDYIRHSKKQHGCAPRKNLSLRSNEHAILVWSLSMSREELVAYCGDGDSNEDSSK